MDNTNPPEVKLQPPHLPSPQEEEQKLDEFEKFIKYYEETPDLLAIKHRALLTVNDRLARYDQECPIIYKESNTLNDQSQINCLKQEYVKLCCTVVTEIMSLGNIYDGIQIKLYDVANVNQSFVQIRPTTRPEICIYVFNQSSYKDFLARIARQNVLNFPQMNVGSTGPTDISYLTLGNCYYILSGDKCECDDRIILLLAYIFRFYFNIPIHCVHIYSDDNMDTAQHGLSETNPNKRYYNENMDIYSMTLKEVGLMYKPMETIAHVYKKNGQNFSTNPVLYNSVVDVNNYRIDIPTIFRILIKTVLGIRTRDNFTRPNRDGIITASGGPNETNYIEYDPAKETGTLESDFYIYNLELNGYRENLNIIPLVQSPQPPQPPPKNPFDPPPSEHKNQRDRIVDMLFCLSGFIPNLSSPSRWNYGIKKNYIFFHIYIFKLVLISGEPAMKNLIITLGKKYFNRDRHIESMTIFGSNSEFYDSLSDNSKYLSHFIYNLKEENYEHMMMNPPEYDIINQIPPPPPPPTKRTLEHDGSSGAAAAQQQPQTQRPKVIDYDDFIRKTRGLNGSQLNKLINRYKTNSNDYLQATNQQEIDGLLLKALNEISMGKNGNFEMVFRVFNALNGETVSSLAGSLNSSTKRKYLKYKQKYLELKKQLKQLHIN